MAQESWGDYLFQLSRKMEDFLYLNFEDSRLYGAKCVGLREIVRIFVEVYGNESKCLLLDEIQNLKGWEVNLKNRNCESSTT